MVNPKIKRDTEKTKKEKKEHKRRDREERKKEKKEKKREQEKRKSIQNIECTNKRNRDGLDSSVDKCCVDSKAVHRTDAEQLERSSLSEEHGLPVLAESLSYSSDGTHSNTKKIKIEQSPSNGNRTTQGKTVLFRLKRREHESAHPTDDVPSTSVRTTAPVTNMFEVLPVRDKDTKDAVAINVEQLALDTTQAGSGSSSILPVHHSSVVKAKKKPKSTYEALFSSWVPPPIHFEAVTGQDNEEWTIPSKKQAGQSRLCLDSLNGVSSLPCSLAVPRAHHVPDAVLFILPLTVLL